MISEIQTCLSLDRRSIREGYSPSSILARNIPKSIELIKEVKCVATEVLAAEKKESADTRLFHQQVQNIAISLERLSERTVTSAAGLRVLIGDLDRDIQDPLNNAFHHFSVSPTLDTIRRDEVYRLLGYLEEQVVNRDCQTYRLYSGSMHPNDFTYTVEVVDRNEELGKLYHSYRKILALFKKLSENYEVTCQIFTSGEVVDREAASLFKKDLNIAGIESAEHLEIAGYDQKNFKPKTASFTFLIYTPAAREELLRYKEIGKKIIPLIYSSYPDKKITKSHKFLDMRTMGLYISSMISVLTKVYVLEENHPVIIQATKDAKCLIKDVSVAAKPDYINENVKNELLHELIVELKRKYQKMKNPGVFSGQDCTNVIQSYVPLNLVLEQERFGPAQKASKGATSFDSFTPQKPLNAADIAHLAKNANRVAVWGRRGTGKSTLLQYITQSWAQESSELHDEVLFNRIKSFTIVIYVTIEDLIRYDEYCERNNLENRGNVLSLYCFLKHVHFSEIHVSPLNLEQLLVELSDQTLYILDGLDEREAFLSDGVDRVRSDLIRAKNFVLSARIENTYALELDQCCHIECIGFGRKEVGEFIQRYIRRDRSIARSLIIYIQQHKFVKEMASIPMLLEILCQHWVLSGGSSVEFLSLTQLYNQIIADLFQKYLESLVEKKKVLTRSVWDLEESVIEYRSSEDFIGILPEEVFDFEEVKKYLQPLGELAFTALSRGMRSFQHAELAVVMGKHFPVAKERSNAFKVFSKLHFLKGELASRDASKQVYDFIAPTFIDYFAARYLSTLEKDLVKQYIRNINFSNSIRFFFGLNPLVKFYIEKARSVQTRWDRVAKFKGKQRNKRNRFFNLKRERSSGMALYLEEVVANWDRDWVPLDRSRITSRFSGTIFEYACEWIERLLESAMSATSREVGSDWMRCVLELKGVQHLYEKGFGQNLIKKVQEGHLGAILLAGELRIREERCMDAMISHLSNPSKEIRLSAVIALKSIIPDSQKHLFKLKELLDVSCDSTREVAQQVWEVCTELYNS